MSGVNGEVSEPTGLTRRSFLTAAGAVGGLALGAAGGYGVTRTSATEQVEAGDAFAGSYPFRSEHPAGVLEYNQAQAIFCAFDVIATTRDRLISLLEDWSLAAERMMAGQPVNDYKTFRGVPPADTGEADDLGPAYLTIAFGFGASLFREEFGIVDKLPEELAAGIPPMSAEYLDLDKSNGDLFIQICAEDAMVVEHALRNLTRLAFGKARLRWAENGFIRAYSASKNAKTPRNLFGFKDGTSNLTAESGEEMLNEHLWIQPGDTVNDWAAGGTYACFRKMQMMFEVWDEIPLDQQEEVFGRDKFEGAPLSGGAEFSDPDFSNPAIPVDSHMAIVHPDNNGGRHMRRRAYSYTEGLGELGRINGGLQFIAFVRNPQTNFVPILSRMSGDQLTEYVKHLGTGLFILPPPPAAGETYVGQRLFKA
ncbi:MAG: Dyp-type peroxidase [Corynebacterium sp.]|nr:Dyp-type peroxidase [Corynebacterium sp.]